MFTLFKEIGNFLENTVSKLKEYLMSGGGMVAVTTAALSNLTGMQKLMLFLLFAIFIDLITGIMAYHYEWKKAGKPETAGYLIQSSKLRQTYTKGATYLFMIGLVYGMSILIFADVRITLGGIIKPLTITEFFTASLIGIEVWSNLENSKRMGVDILGGVIAIAKKGWETFNGVKKGEFKDDK